MMPSLYHISSCLMAVIASLSSWKGQFQASALFWIAAALFDFCAEVSKKEGK